MLSFQIYNAIKKKMQYIKLNLKRHKTNKKRQKTKTKQEHVMSIKHFIYYVMMLEIKFDI